MTVCLLEFTPRPEMRIAATITWRDPGTGCTVIAADPAVEVDLWNTYLEGAYRSYLKHGVECVLDLDTVRDGADTAVFFVLVDDRGRVIGGARAAGPLLSADDSHAVVEWAGHPDVSQVRQAITERAPYGVLEAKSAWVDSNTRAGRSLSETLARVPLWSMWLLDARFVLATAADYVIERWRTAGGVVSDLPAVAYPDARYRTKMMWWDRTTFADHIAAHQLSRFEAEVEQLTASTAAIGGFDASMLRAG